MSDDVSNDIMGSPPTYLTAAQMADVLRHLGYYNYGSTVDNVTIDYLRLGLEQPLWRLTHLADYEVTYVTDQLNYINSAYSAWKSAQANISNESVAVVKVNLAQVAQCRGFYIQGCRDLANWLGIEYLGRGPRRRTI